MSNENSLVMTDVIKQISEDKDVSDQVQARLKRADELERALARMTDLYNEEVEKRGRVTSERDALKQLDLKAQELHDKELHLGQWEKQLNMQVDLNNLKITSANDRVEDHKEMVRLIFRNPVIMKKGMVPVMTQSMDQPYSQGDGTYVMQGQGSHASREETTSEESVE